MRPKRAEMWRRSALVIAFLAPFVAHIAHGFSGEPARPKVLLLGDSISKGYAPFVQVLLASDAVVSWPRENCHATVDGLANLDRWLGHERWDVIHFNFGLHDLKHMRNGAPVPPTEGAPNVSLTDYEANLERIVRRLERTGATLVWASTTPVPPGAEWRAHGDAVRYNAVALRVMKRHGIAVDDLYAHVAARLDVLQLPHNVHYTTFGYLVLGRQVAASVRAALTAGMRASLAPGSPAGAVRAG